MRPAAGTRSVAACLAVLVPLAAAVASGQAGRAPTRPGIVLRFAPSPSTLRSCARVSWVFQVSNVGATPERLSFRDGQRGEVALSRGRRVVYRWSARRVFTQAGWSRTIRRGGTWRFALADVLRVPAGRYSLVARLTGTTTAQSRLVVRRTVLVRAPARACGTRSGSPPPPASPRPPAQPSPTPPSTPPRTGGAPAQPPGATLATASDSVRLAYGSYCWMLAEPTDGVAAPCTDLVPPDDPDIPRLTVGAGETLTLRLAFEPTSLAILLGGPGVTARIDSELRRELSVRVPEEFRPPAVGLLVVVADGSAGDAGAGQVTYLAWLTAAAD